MDQTRAAGPGRRRGRDGVYELFIVALTVFSLMMLAAYFVLPLAAAVQQILLQIDVLVSLIFLADSIRSLRLATDKRAYLKWGWLDFLGSIPLILPLRVARVGRLARAWRTLRARRPREVGEDLERNRAQGAALLMVLLVIVVLTGATVAVLEFEIGAAGANIRSGDDALWWAIVTMATVGYGQYFPVTTGGRLAAVALMTVGVGMFGVLASYLARLFLPNRSEDEGDLDEIKAGIAATNTRLEAIEAMLSDLVPARSRDAEREPD